MITVAVIEQNNINFSSLHPHLTGILYTDKPIKGRKAIEDLIKPYVSMHQMEEDDFIEFACLQLSKDPTQTIFHTEVSFSTPKGCCEIMFCDEGEMNQIASLLSLKHTVVRGKCVVILNKYNPLRKSDLTFEILTSLIKRRFYHSAILIKPSGECIKYYYQDIRYLIHMLFGVDSSDTIESCEVEVLQYTLSMFFRYKQSEINPMATRINGMYRLHGPVLVMHNIKKTIPTNLSLGELETIDKASYGRLYDRKADESDDIWTRYATLQAHTIKDNCVLCGDPGKITCERCYRVRYCSKQCQIEFRGHHVDDCINEKSIVPK